MTTASGVRNRPGPLGTLAFTAGGTVELLDYRPDRRISHLTLIFRTSQPGTLSVFRIDPYGNEVLHLPVQTIAAVTVDDEVFDIVYMPTIGSIRAKFTNSNATPGTCSAEMTDNRI